jgi:hypothetical protein
MSAFPAAAEFSGTSRSTSATVPPVILRSLAVVVIEDGLDLRPVLASGPPREPWRL